VGGADPGGRSTTALAAGVVGYPVARFQADTAVAVLIWASAAALLGYLGGAVFAASPLLGLAAAWTTACPLYRAARRRARRRWVPSGSCASRSTP